MVQQSDNGLYSQIPQAVQTLIGPIPSNGLVLLGCELFPQYWVSHCADTELGDQSEIFKPAQVTRALYLTLPGVSHAVQRALYATPYLDCV